MGLNLNDFLDEFRSEADEHLRAFDAHLLTLERDPDAAAPIRAMFLAAHSLKGSGAMMDIADVEALAHAVEDVLARLRDGRQRLDAATATLLFRASDLLGERIARATPGAAPVDGPITAMITALATQDGSASAKPQAVPAPDSPPGADEQPVALLVEDSPTVRLLHAALLAEVGLAVDLASDGQEALALAGTRRYALIVCGLETGGLRGPALAAALHERADGGMPPFILTHNDAADPPDPPGPGIAARLRTAPPSRQQLTATARHLLARR